MKYKLNRNANFELLRVFCMILIILYHIVLYGGEKFIDSYSFFNIVYSLFYCGGKLGVALFIMITGYFMIDKKVEMKKIFRLEGQVLFYSILSFIIYNIFDIGEIDGPMLAKTFFPNLVGTYWFFTSYFVLYFLMPYINKAIKKMKEIEFRKLLIILFVFLILIPSLIIYRKPYSPGIYLIFYYLVGAYIKLYFDDKVFKKRYLILGSGIVYSIIVLFYLILSNLVLSNPILYDFVFSFADLKSIFIFLVAIFLFMFFKQLDIKNCRIINLLGSVSFGVYLFHDNFLMRDILWVILFKVSNYYDFSCFFIYGLFLAVLVYIVGGFIESIRKIIFDNKLFDFFWNKICFGLKALKSRYLSNS